MSESMYLVLCNAPADESKHLARTLVGERLAACVNLIEGVTSFYYWGERFCVEEEHTLIIKVAAERHDELVERLVELHSYEVPEVISYETQGVYPPYLEWVKATTQSK